MVPPREWLRRRLPPRCTRHERNLALARRAVIERPFYVRMWPTPEMPPGDRGGGFLGYCGRGDYHWLRLSFQQSESGTADA
jgi:hypothetical protein